MPFSLTILLAFDYQRQHEFQQTEWQNTLMRLFFRDISPDGLDGLFIQPGYDFSLGCSGVTCVDGEVTDVTFGDFYHGNFNISALPHSTLSIIIPECGQTFQINTRSLPSRLRTVDLSFNEIYGFLDLTVLPQKLEQALLQNNRLTGPISLVSLPRTLARLDLQDNQISQKTVWYDDLPGSLHTVKLVMHRGTNEIREVRAVSSGNIVQDKTIFKHMKASNVH